MPTLKAEEFCKAFYTWAEACQTELPTDDEGTKQWRKDFADHWSFIALAIHKSCLLDRLIYGRERLRTEMCPEHKGKWSGCVFEKLDCGCQFGANATGWLKPTKTQKRDKPKISTPASALYSLVRHPKPIRSNAITAARRGPPFSLKINEDTP